MDRKLYASQSSSFSDHTKNNNHNSSFSGIDNLVSSIDELDPSLTDGARVIYDREVPVETRAEPTAEGVVQHFKFKILVVGEDPSVEVVRIEISSETDLFLHYSFSIEYPGYPELQESQKLTVDFNEFPNVLIQMLNNCIREPQMYLAGLVSVDEETFRLEFIQNIGYKFIELLSLPFKCSSEETVRQHVVYRYNGLKSRLAAMQTRLQEISSVVKVRNPSLLLQMGRQSSGGSPSVRRSRNQQLDHSM